MKFASDHAVWLHIRREYRPN